MNNQEIKNKIWEDIEKYISLENDDFNKLNCLFKINNYDLVIKGGVFEITNERCFFVTITYNPHDDYFNDDNIYAYTRWKLDIAKTKLEEIIDLLEE